MGSTAIRSAVAFPGLKLSGVITSSPDKEGKDAATFARLDAETGVSATTDVDAALAGCDAVAYMASGDIRPDEAIADIERCLRAGKHVVTPSLYSLYDPRSGAAGVGGAPHRGRRGGRRVTARQRRGPGLGQRRARRHRRRACAPGSESIHCQEIFDYSTYNQPYAVKVSCGFGGSMDEKIQCR